MNLLKCDLPGLILIEPKISGDHRGFFLESFNAQRYEKEAGIPGPFVQDNLSFSQRETLRGLHLQNPNAQGKLISVLQGEIFDVVVDVRRSSPTFKQWYGNTLSAENKRQLFVPPGFAHGFAVLSETALFHYKCTDYYSPKDEISILWNDPDLNIQWPIATPILSPRDAAAPCLKDIPSEKLFP